MKLQHFGNLSRKASTTDHIQTWMMILEKLLLLAQDTPDIDKTKDEQFSV